MSSRAPAARGQRVAVSEAELQATVIDMAHAHGWLCWHSQQTKVNPFGRNGQRRLDPGFPDLVLAHPEKGVLFVELKRENGKVSKAQRMWIWALGLGGNPVHVWRPSDLDSGEIEHVLKELES